MTISSHTDRRPPRPPGRRGLLIAPLVIFAALALMFAYALKVGDPSKVPSALIGKPAPEIELPALEGLTDGREPVPGFRTADLRGGAVSVVNFWASWCAPCVQEHPLLIELKDRTGVVLYGVNYKDQPAAARRFLGHYGNPFTAVGTDAQGRAAIEWGVYGMPETFVVDGSGTVVAKHIGPISPQVLATTLLPAIAEAQGTARPKR